MDEPPCGLAALSTGARFRTLLPLNSQHKAFFAFARGRDVNWHGMLGTALLLSCGGLAACGGGPQISAGGSAQGVPATAAGPQSAGGPGETRYIVIRAGQSLGRIAEAYHVPKQAIIAANHLTPPYSLKAGARLAIPLAAAPAGTQAVSSTNVAPSASANPGHAAGGSAPMRHAKIRHAEPEVIPLDDPAPAQAGTAAADPPANPASSAATSAPRAPSRLADPGSSTGSPATP
jgi:LysM repeat protein